MLQSQFIMKEEIDEDYGKFIIEPLEQGYGHTLGNSLRRVLLSSLEGAAITRIKIGKVRHQFSTLPGLKEDIVELILNIKKIRLRIESSGNEEMKLTLSKQGAGEVKASDIELPAGVTIVNPDLYLGMLADKKAKLEIEMYASKGYGYGTANEKKISTIGYIPVDSLYSPVTRVNYKVEATRVGRMTDLDKLILEVWTDGTISPREALEKSAKTLVSYLVLIYEPKTQEVEAPVQESKIDSEVLATRIEELDIPTRIVNALENAGISTIKDMLETKREELMKVKNLGVKSIRIIEEKLAEKGLELS